MKLIEWTSIYIDHLNTYKRNLNKKEQLNDTKLKCVFNDSKKLIYLIHDQLTKEIFLELKNSSNIIIVCLNTKNNLNFLIKNWSEFIKYKELKIIFVNLLKNEKWSIVPYVHNLISDPGSLKQGLKSMFESVFN